jgi:hypothetical protein
LNRQTGDPQNRGFAFGAVSTTPMVSFYNIYAEVARVSIQTENCAPDCSSTRIRFVDALAKAGEKHAYAIISVNSVGLKSNPTADVP